jgi:DNA-binding transcriptional LysR family regulator
MMSAVELDPSHYAALLALLEERHVTRAARRLGVTQSSASHRLKVLREALRDPLLVRGTEGLTRTPRAEQLLEPLRRALSALREAVQPSPGFSPATEAYVARVGMPDPFASALPALVAKLAHVAPNVTLRIEQVPSDVTTALERGSPSIVVAPSTFAQPGILSRPLGTLRFSAVMRKGHPLARGALDRARWLAFAHVVVSPGNTVENPVANAIGRAGADRKVGLSVSSFLAGLHVVAGSDLVMNAPRPLVNDVAATLGLVVRELPLRVPEVPFALLFHERYRADPAHAFVRELVHDCFSRALAAGPERASGSRAEKPRRANAAELSSKEVTVRSSTGR